MAPSIRYSHCYWVGGSPKGYTSCLSRLMGVLYANLFENFQSQIPNPKTHSPPKVDGIWLWVYIIIRSTYTPYSIYLRGTIRFQVLSASKEPLSRPLSAPKSLVIQLPYHKRVPSGLYRGYIVTMEKKTKVM